jgi:hypothetical protein
MLMDLFYNCCQVHCFVLVSSRARVWMYWKLHGEVKIGIRGSDLLPCIFHEILFGPLIVLFTQYTAH